MAPKPRKKKRRAHHRIIQDVIKYVEKQTKKARKQCFGSSRPTRLSVLQFCANRLTVPYSTFLPPLQERRAEFQEKVRKGFVAKAPRRASKCFVCSQPKPHHVHHIIPLSHGGVNTMKNLVWVCVPCHDEVHGYSTAVGFEKITPKPELKTQPNDPRQKQWQGVRVENGKKVFYVEPLDKAKHFK